MLRFPNCKINIGLSVTRRRGDGFHELETVFYPLPLHDSLEIMKAAQSSVHIYGLPVDGPEKANLVWKACELLRADFGNQVPELEIHLLKHIPMGAGLGGGSSDGAAMLQLINDYCMLGMDERQLADYALRLGSDCPFFIYNTPQFARGRGELMQPVTLDLSAYSIQLICPRIHVSTGTAFRNIKPRPAAFDLSRLEAAEAGQWRDYVHNDFEDTVFDRHPELKTVKEQLYAQGAVYASMSGSGSAIYGIFRKGEKAVWQHNHPVYYFE